ncbi:hypothetical protein H5C72_23595 (plasmid) [Escherichia coli]|nr:hypothetical protein [Escherichia coli]
MGRITPLPENLLKSIVTRWRLAQLRCSWAFRGNPAVSKSAYVSASSSRTLQVGSRNSPLAIPVRHRS